MSSPSGKSQFYEEQSTADAKQEGVMNNTLSPLESTGFASFLDPTTIAPPLLQEQNLEENAEPIRNGVAINSRGSGPDFKDQMRHAQAPPNNSAKGATSLPNRRRRPPVERVEFRNDEVQLVDAALVPDEEIVREKVKKHKQRSKFMMFGLCGAVAVNAFLVSGALLTIFCIAGDICRRDRNDADNDLLRVTSCERATLVDLNRSKHRMSGIIDTSRQGRLCDPDIPGNWYKVIGTGEALVANTCSPLTDSDTTITVFKGDSCGNLSCVEANDDWNYCPHGDSFSQVGWFGATGETYFIRVSGFDQASLGTYGVAIEKFNDQPPRASCEIDAWHECRSSDGVDCATLVSSRRTSCQEKPQNIQFLYTYARCGRMMEGVVCEDESTPSSRENVTLVCNQSSSNSTEITTGIFKTTPPSFVQGEMVNVQLIANEAFHGSIDCEIISIDSGNHLQRLRIDFNETWPSLGDTFGSLQVVACGTVSCFQDVLFTAYVANDGSKPVQIVESSFVAGSIDDDQNTVDNIFKSLVLNPGDIEKRLVNSTLNLCQDSDYVSTVQTIAQDSGGDTCRALSNIWVPFTPSTSQPTQVPRSLPQPISPPVSQPVSQADAQPFPSSGLRTPQPTANMDGTSPTLNPVQSTETGRLLDSAAGRVLLALIALVEVLLVAGCAFSLFRSWTRRQEFELDALKRKQHELKEKQDKEHIDEEFDEDESKHCVH